MWSLCLLSTIFCGLALSVVSLPVEEKKAEAYLPELNMDAVEIITYNGYPAQEFTATTEDGYELTVHRIPYGKHGPPPADDTSSRPVVFLQHGLEASSTCWLTMLTNQSLAYILADAGMDVFLGNFRGNVYSQKHVSLDPKKHEFWEFSYDEMAAYDLPAMIYKTLSVSGAQQVYYVGHSEGTMAAFAAFSDNTALSSKVKHFFALAPAAMVGHSKGLLHFLGNTAWLYEWLVKLVDNNDFALPLPIMRILAELVCGSESKNPMCANVFFLIAGPNSHQLNETNVPVYAAHNPAGTSTQNMIHFAQGVHDKTFCKYDYKNAKKNMEKYGQATPPDYHPENMKVPVTLFSGAIDYLADPEDVLWLMNTLKTITDHYTFEDFNHLDFIWGERAPTEIYSKIVKSISHMERLRYDVD